MTADYSHSEFLAQLDEDQLLAATALHGPVAIVAGAGSGKTRTISHRIAYGIETGAYTASRVFALSYTNRAAAEIRSRLRQLGPVMWQYEPFTLQPLLNFSSSGRS